MHRAFRIFDAETVLAKGASVGSAPAVAGLRSKEAGAAPLQRQRPCGHEHKMIVPGTARTLSGVQSPFCKDCYQHQ